MRDSRPKPGEDEEFKRMKEMISFILARDVNVLSSPVIGSRGNDQLREAFLGLIGLLRPDVFCDVGANDGATAIAVKSLVPECEVFAFQANPEIFKTHESALRERGVHSLNLAVSDTVGTTTIHVPRTLSRRYEDGRLVPAKITESAQTGKSSLLLRDEDATYDDFEIQCETLDSFLLARARPGARFVLWIDVEGIAERVLAGSTQILPDTDAIFIECETFPFWKDGSSASGVTRTLMEAGFIPVARDREYDDKQFNMLFVAASAAHLLYSGLFDQSSNLRASMARCDGIEGAPRRGALFRIGKRVRETFAGMGGAQKLQGREVAATRAQVTARQEIEPTDRSATPDRVSRKSTVPSPSSVASLLQAEVPVFIPCFNNPTYTAGMVRQLTELGFAKIVLLDGGSSYPGMRELLDSLSDVVKLVALPGNPGPRHAFVDPAELALLPRHFCVTDPDIAFNSEMPRGFLGDLAALADRERIGKVGLALDISDPANMRSDDFVIGKRRYKIWEWERQYWRTKRPPLRKNGDPVFVASVDTTFALYDRKYFDPQQFLKALRVGGRFTCRHLPWYKDGDMPADEEEFYRRSASHSYYYQRQNSE